jgi:hypothetical protein
MMEQVEFEPKDRPRREIIAADFLDHCVGMTMSEKNDYAHLVPQSEAKLTPKQERFHRLMA